MVIKFGGNDARVANKDTVIKTHFVFANHNPTVILTNIFQKLMTKFVLSAQKSYDIKTIIISIL